MHLYRAVGDRRSRRLGHTLHALPIICGSPPGCSGRERGVRLTAMKGGSVTVPDLRLSSGCWREEIWGGSEITVAKPMHLKSKHTTLSPYAKIVTSRSLASGTLAHHPLHRTQRRRRELGRRTASRESADSLPPRATLFLTTSNFSEEPGLAPPPEAIEHPPLQAAIGTDRVSRLEGHTAIKARGCALVLNYRN